MYPYLNIGFERISSWLLLAIIAVIICSVKFLQLCKISYDAQSRNKIVIILIIGIITGIIGAQLPSIIHRPFVFWFGIKQAVWYKAVIVSFAAISLTSVMLHIKLFPFLDIIGYLSIIGYAILRLGCFLAGDGCYGLPTGLPWGVSFPNGVCPVYIPVHPTPLYEMAASILIIAALNLMNYQKHIGTGIVVSFSLITMSIERFFIEFIRLSIPKYWGMTEAQVVCILFFLLGIFILLQNRKAKSYS